MLVGISSQVRQDMVSPYSEEAEALPYLQNPGAKPRAKKLLSSVSNYMDRMRQDLARSENDLHRIQRFIASFQNFSCLISSLAL